MGIKILVTGATGFIGSHLVERLLREGWEVRAMAHYRSSPDLGNLQADCEVVKGDIRDERCVEAAVAGCDLVVHLAALVDVPYSSIAPRSYLETNLIGTYNVLEACRRDCVPLIATSSSEVYGTASYTPIDEQHPLSAQSPYAASKIAADQLGAAYRRCYGLPVLILRPFNTYGPRQSERAVLPWIIRQLLKGPKVEVGNVEAKRDWLYVEDSCNGYIKAIEYLMAGNSGDTFNLATGRATSVLRAIRLAADIIGVEPVIVENPKLLRPGDSEVKLLMGHAEKALTMLGWKPLVSFEEGLRKTIDWFLGRP